MLFAFLSADEVGNAAKQDWSSEEETLLTLAKALGSFIFQEGEVVLDCVADVVLEQVGLGTVELNDCRFFVVRRVRQKWKANKRANNSSRVVLNQLARLCAMES